MHTSSAPVYRQESVEHYRGNPLIEALPDIPDRAQAYQALAYAPPKRDPAFRSLPTYRRVELLHQMQELFVPGEQHIESLQKLIGLVRSCYSYRDPNRPEVQRALYRAARGEPTQISRLSPSGGGSNGRVLWGVTGAGKTSFVDRFLSYVPSEPIVHTNLQGGVSSWPQIPSIRIQCARTLKGTASALLRQFDEKLGTTFWARGNTRMSTGDYVGKVIQAMSVHFVGLLIVEDVQNLKEMRAESVEVLEHLTDIMEESGVPVLLVSTYAARVPLFSNTKVSSKLTANGVTDFAPLAADDEDWHAFVEELWSLNIFAEPVEMPPSLPVMLHFHTMGVRRFARETLGVAFEYAARERRPTVDEPLLDRVVAAEMLKYQEAVNILRRRHVRDHISAEDAKRFEDVLPPDLGSTLLTESIERRQRDKQASAKDAKAGSASRDTPRARVQVLKMSSTPHRKSLRASKAQDRAATSDQAEIYYQQLRSEGKLA